MSRIQRRPRGLSSVRTRADARGTKARHELLMRLTCLEMERARHAQEAASLEARLARIRTRDAELEAQIRELAEAAGLTDEPAAPDEGPRRPLRDRLTFTY